MRMSRAVARRRISSPATRPGASPPTSPSCRVAARALRPEATSGLLWPGAGPSTAKGYPLS